VVEARLDLPLLANPRTPDLTGGVSEVLAKWRAQKVIALDPGMLNNATVAMNLPNEPGTR
jgi:uncharacterized protein